MPRAEQRGAAQRDGMAFQGSGSGPNGAGERRFAVGTVVTTALKVVGANVARFLGIIFAVAIPAVVLIAAAVILTGAATPQPGQPGLSVTLTRGSAAETLFLLALAVISLVAYVLIQCGIIYATLQTLRGRRVGIRESLQVALALLPRGFAASLILVVVLVLGGTAALMLFRAIVGAAPPGAGAVLLLGALSTAVVSYVLVLTWVFMPAIVFERSGPLACFRRSIVLTTGRRWNIFAVFALVFVANWVVTLLSNLLPRIGAPMAGAALNYTAALFFMAFGAVLAAVGYYALRVEKEGVAIDDVVRVFD
jgi:hypothetical protein